MDLESLKEKSRRITAPAIDTRSVQEPVRSIDNLIARLKENDERERKKLRKSLPFFIIAAIIFVIAFVAVIVPGGVPLNPSTLFLRGMLMIIYMFIVLAVGKKLKDLAAIDYAEPVRAFLAKAEKRYAFATPGYYVFAVTMLLFLGYGTFFYFRDLLRRFFEITDPLPGVGVTLVFFGAVCALGFWASRKDWKKEKEGIWLQVRRMREELDREENNGK
jgi:magnesium-transporting ATPase (P-type)